ncbi:unnamed protein product [Rotaria socialis]|uniref:Uncharacterized protein n=3 Tax=Rotaria socialis TaxID=392032 RepID=A0A821Z6V1_9BILA|nr:unnamed protein product [Rotaria socialis]CAF4972855.1 unnamed protein product [Rotaria socialis]
MNSSIQRPPKPGKENKLPQEELPHQCIARLEATVQSLTTANSNLTNENVELQRLNAQQAIKIEGLEKKLKVLEDKLDGLMAANSGGSDSSNSPPLVKK